MGRKGEELDKNLKGKRKRLLTYNCSFESFSPADSHSWVVCLCCYGLGTN